MVISEKKTKWFGLVVYFCKSTKAEKNVEICVTAGIDKITTTLSIFTVIKLNVLDFVIIQVNWLNQRLRAKRLNLENNWCFGLNRIPENAGYSYVDDDHYDVYIRQDESCTEPLAPPPPKSLCSGQGIFNPRRRKCECDVGFEGLDCSIPNCESIYRLDCGQYG